MIKKTFVAFLVSLSIASSLWASEDETYFLAKESFEQKLYPTATRLFKSFLDFYPESKYLKQVYLYIAKSLFHSQLFEEAQKYLSKSEDMFADDQDYFYLRAQISYELDDNANAKKYYKKARRFSSQEDRIFYMAALNMAKLSTYYGQRQEAEDLFEEILSDCDDRLLKTQAYAGLAKLYLKDYDNSALHDILLRWEKDLDTLEETALRNFYRAKLYIRESNDIDAYLLLMQALNYVTDIDVRDAVYSSLYKMETNKKKKESYILLISDKSLSAALNLINAKESQANSEYIRACDEFLMLNKNKLAYNLISLEFAEALYREGRINDSIKVFKQYLENKEKEYDLEMFYRASYGLALAHLKKKEVDKAYGIFSDLTRKDIMPQMRATMMLYATQNHEEEQRYEEAMRVYKEIELQDYAKDYRDYLYLKMAYVSMQLMHFEESINYLDLLDSRYPQTSYREESLYYRTMAYFQMEDFVLADELASSFLEIFESSEFAIDILKLQIRAKAAQEHLDSEELNDFYVSLLESTDDTKHKQGLIYEQALAYFSRAQYVKAVELFTELSINDEFEQRETVLYYLANAYYQMENLNEAKKNYKQLLLNFDSGENVAAARYELAQIHIYEQDYGLAESLLFKNIRMRDENIIFQSALSLKEILVEQFRYSSAQQLYDQLAQRFPHKKAYCLNNKVDIAFAQGQWESVVVIARQALEAGYKSDTLFYKNAFAHEKLENYDEAIELYNELVFTAAASKEFIIKAYLRLAKLYELLADIDKALMIYARVVDLKEEESEYAQEQIDILKKKDSNS